MSDFDGAGERPLSVDELFVSTTDRKGHIRMTNHVFVRISGYARDELIGRAHNVIRHPDMPRAVFRIFWDELGAGRPVTAYVKNRAKDGAFYWVMAIAVPVEDGYLSVRIKPTGPLFAVARSLYADVLAVERAIEGDEPRRRRQAIDAGVVRLLDGLRDLGYADYGAFMRAAFTSEVAARDAATGGAVALDLGDADDGLRAVGEASIATAAALRGLGDRLADHGTLSETLGRKSSFVRELAESIRLFSLNAILVAGRLVDGAALGAVAGLLRTRSDDAAPAIDRLSSELEQSVQLLGETSFRAAAGRVQSEMMTIVVGELQGDAVDASEAAPQLRLLAAAVSDAADAICTSMDAVDANLGRLMSVSRAVERHLGVIRALEVNGRIEAARAADTEQVRVLFEEIGKQVETASEEIGDFAALAARTHRGENGRAARESRELTATVKAAVAALS